MKKRLQKFLREMLGLSFHPASSQEISFPECPTWMQEDADHLKSFLGTPTGQSLIKKMRAMQIANCIRACKGEIEPKLAGGITFTVDWFEKLSISGESPVKDSTTEDSLRENADTLI